MPTPKQLRKDILAILQDDLSGQEVLVVDHTDPTLVGVAGLVENETKNTLLVRTEDKVVRVPKASGVFRFTGIHAKYKVKGMLLVGTPKKRKKKKLRHW